MDERKAKQFSTLEINIKPINSYLESFIYHFCNASVYICAGFIMYNENQHQRGNGIPGMNYYVYSAPCCVVKYILQDRSFVSLFYSTGPGIKRMCHTISPEFRMRMLYEPHYTYRTGVYSFIYFSRFFATAKMQLPRNI